jgi:hypothetical protein
VESSATNDVLSISEIRIGPRSDRKPTADAEAADEAAGVDGVAAIVNSPSCSDVAADADAAEPKILFPRLTS